jgi:peptide subunit release factor 1 (eRF1)
MHILRSYGLARRGVRVDGDCACGKDAVGEALSDGWVRVLAVAEPYVKVRPTKRCHRDGERESGKEGVTYIRRGHRRGVGVSREGLVRSAAPLMMA